MPRQDGTGPEGKGPGTGRGLGNCDPKEYKQDKGVDSPKVSIPKGKGQGKGLGKGLGRGFRGGKKEN